MDTTIEQVVKNALATAMMLAVLMPWARAQDINREKSVTGFSVLDMRGEVQHSPSMTGAVTVVMFFSTRCPMSNAFNYRRNQIYRTYRDRVRFIVIDSNVNEPLEEERGYAQNAGFDFPVFHDLENQAADVFGARNTTETFVLDARGAVRYRGYIEDAPNPERTTKQGLRLAIESVLGGQPVATPETLGIGCAIRRPQPVAAKAHE